MCTDRRQQGVQKVEISDEDSGAKIHMYSLNIDRARVWVGLLAGSCAILAGVFAATRYGVRVEVREAIEEATVSETGCIHREMHYITQEAFQVMTKTLQSDLTAVETEMSKLKVNVAEVKVKQELTETKMDKNHAEVMRAIKNGS